MGLCGAAQGWGSQKAPSLKSVTKSYNGETWHSYALTKEDLKKYIDLVIHSLSLAEVSILLPEINNFCSVKKHMYIDCILIHNF